MDVSIFAARYASIKRGLSRHAVSVCPSVCVSVTFVDCVKTNEHIFKTFSPSGSQIILVFPYQTAWQYYDWNPFNGGVECRWGIGRNRDRRDGYRSMTCWTGVRRSTVQFTTPMATHQ